MLLAMDIGNSEITLGLFEGDRLVITGRHSTAKGDRQGITGVIRRLSEGMEIEAAILCSVVPLVTSAVIQACKDVVHISPMEVSVVSDTGLRVLYDTPEKLGIDRLVNAAAAWERRRKAVIIVDFGTATTFDVVNGRGEYIGGAIFPGIRMAAASLAEKTARLPQVEPEKPARVIGRSTEEGIRSSLYYGYAGLVEGMVTRILQELGEDADVLATGGMAGGIAGECRAIGTVVPFLTLEGLKVIFLRNMNRMDGVADNQPCQTRR